jgi:hypothetical protein
MEVEVIDDGINVGDAVGSDVGLLKVGIHDGSFVGRKVGNHDDALDLLILGLTVGNAVGSEVGIELGFIVIEIDGNIVVSVVVGSTVGSKNVESIVGSFVVFKEGVTDGSNVCFKDGDDDANNDGFFDGVLVDN